MARLSRMARQRHDEAMQLVFGQDKRLTHDQVLTVLNQYNPVADGHYIQANGAFFTPWSLAQAVASLGIDRGRVVDLCAGIGALTYAMACRDGYGPEWGSFQFTAVELNERYVEIGRRIMPEVEWVRGDVFDLAVWKSRERFGFAISNPPFGRPYKAESADWLRSNGCNLDLMAIEVALRVAWANYFILPMSSVPAYAQYSAGALNFGRDRPSKEGTKLKGALEKFVKALDGPEEDRELVFTGTGVYDTESFRSDWIESVPVTEIASVSFEPGEDVLPLLDPEPEPIQLTMF